MGAYEKWVYVNKEGKIIEHIENDGPRFMRRGAERYDEVVSLDYVRQRYGEEEYLRIKDAQGDHLIASM
jgi:hypothetical protein